ncbi:hypothetical protein ACFQ10_41985 [Streptomyces indonesiensis]
MTAKARTAQPSLRTTVRDPRHGGRSSLLWTLYLHAPLSRQELINRTGLGATTVSAVIGELIAEGVVTEEAESHRLRLPPGTGTSSASRSPMPGSGSGCSTSPSPNGPEPSTRYPPVPPLSTAPRPPSATS